MGRVSTCTELIIWNAEPPIYPTNHTTRLARHTDPAPATSIRRTDSKHHKSIPHLIHAVCGSGKTEILFEPIHKLLTEGKSVCIAAPRVDVILELEPRLRAAFPQTTIEALYGGAESTTDSAPQLILATTHQLYRFRHAFDAIFVDEADAFPYTADETLETSRPKSSETECTRPFRHRHTIRQTPS